MSFAFFKLTPHWNMVFKNKKNERYNNKQHNCTTRIFANAARRTDEPHSKEKVSAPEYKLTHSPYLDHQSASIKQCLRPFSDFSRPVGFFSPFDYYGT